MLLAPDFFSFFPPFDLPLAADVAFAVLEGSVFLLVVVVVVVVLRFGENTKGSSRLLPFLCPALSSASRRGRGSPKSTAASSVRAALASDRLKLRSARCVVTCEMEKSGERKYLLTRGGHTSWAFRSNAVLKTTNLCARQFGSSHKWC